MARLSAEQRLLHTKVDRMLMEFQTTEKERTRQAEALYAAIVAQQGGGNEESGVRSALSDLGKEFIRAMVSVVATGIGTYLAQRIILRVLEKRGEEQSHSVATERAKDAL